MEQKPFRIYLRALECNDYEKSIGWRKDDTIWRTMLGPKYFVSKVFEKKWIEEAIFGDEQNSVLGICYKETDELIGFGYLTAIDYVNKNAFSGKLIGGKDFWSKGLGTEVTLLILYHAFEHLGLVRVESRQLAGHQAAIRSIEKIGYKPEAVLREAVFKNGKYHDVNVMSILKEEFDRLLPHYAWEGGFR